MYAGSDAGCLTGCGDPAMSELQPAVLGFHNNKMWEIYLLNHLADTT